jgi:glycosyltransferase involved in cell wall biosynthesis
MRILMLAQFYPPIMGGEERHVANLSINLAERGHDVSVVTLWHKGMPEFETDRGVRIYRIRGTMQRMNILFSENSRQYAPPFPDPEMLLALRRIILNEQPDIVHAHNWIVHSFTPLKAWSKAKLVMSLHDCSLACVQKRFMRHDILCSGPGLTKCLACATHFYGITKGPPSALANFFWAERARHAVDMFLPVSQAIVESNQLDKYGVRYRIIPNFIADQMDTMGDDTHPLLAQLPTGDFLLFVGDVTLDKGAEVLLQAYKALNIQVALVFIGKLFVPGLAEHLPSNVFLMGPWPHAAVTAAWRRSSIALMPSLCPDASPTVAMEAMAQGRPIIASRIGGLIDIVADGETGLLLPAGNVEALRQALQQLLDAPEQREHMGMRARQRVKAFQAATVVPRIEQIYRELVGAGSSDVVIEAESR